MEAKKKPFDRNAYQREYMSQKRMQNPEYGKPEQIIKDLQGSIFLNNERIAWVDDFVIFQKKDRSWDGWANLTWRFVNDKLIKTFNDNRMSEYYIEIEKGDKKYQSKIVMTDFNGGGRRYRLEFMGRGVLNIE